MKTVADIIDFIGRKWVLVGQNALFTLVRMDVHLVWTKNIITHQHYRKQHYCVRLYVPS